MSGRIYEFEVGIESAPSPRNTAHMLIMRQVITPLSGGFHEDYRGNDFRELLRVLDSRLEIVSSDADGLNHHMIFVRKIGRLSKNRRQKIDEVEIKHRQRIEEKVRQYNREVGERYKDPAFRAQQEYLQISIATGGFTRPYRIKPEWW